MGRIYSIAISAAVSAAQDVFEINSANNMVTILHQLVMSQEASVVSQQLRMTIQRMGSQGTHITTITPRPFNKTDTAFAGTVFANDTARAGTPTLLHTEGWNTLNGLQWWPSPDDRIIIPPSGILIVGLETAPFPILTLDAAAILEELG